MLRALQSLADSPRTRRSGVARAAVGLAALTICLGLTSCGGGSDDDNPSGPLGPAQDRVVSVRVYQHGAWTVFGETPKTVGAAIARLEPAWVSSLIRLSSTEALGADEISAWNTIRKLVRDKVPEAQFDIELNALEYKSADDLVAMMEKVRAKLGNEGWFFDFYTPAYEKSPEVVEAAIANAHEHGEWIGGNAFGLGNDPKVPPSSDFIAVQDFRFKIDLAGVRALAKQAPTAFHLGNSPADPNSDGCVFIEKLTAAERVAYVTKRAKQQAANDFRFAYPVFFPECEKPGNDPNSLFSYNALKDPPMMSTIEGLLSKND